MENLDAGILAKIMLKAAASGRRITKPLGFGEWKV